MKQFQPGRFTSGLKIITSVTYEEEESRMLELLVALIWITAWVPVAAPVVAWRYAR